MIYDETNVAGQLRLFLRPLEGIKDTRTEWRLGPLTIDKTRPAWRMGWGGHIDHSTRVRAFRFKLSDTPQVEGWAIIFHANDAVGSEQEPDERFLGWAPLEKAEFVRCWVDFMNLEIGNRLAGKPYTPLPPIR